MRAVYEDDVIKMLNKGWARGIYPCTAQVHNLPPAEPRWIPCSERLPELRHDVLLTVFFHEKWNVTEGYRQDGEFMFWNHGRLDSVLDEENRVIAWMPKPEPFKGVTDGRD